MPKCKNCGREIPKSDKDICRYCGERNPFEGVEEETGDITQFIDIAQNDGSVNVKFKRKKKGIYCFLMALLGTFGAHLLYINKYLNWIILILFNTAFIVGGGFLFELLNLFEGNMIFLNWIISFGILFAIYIIIAIIVFFKGDIVDSNDQQVI